MINSVKIECVTPTGVTVAKKGIEWQVIITYPKGQGNTKRFSFFIHSKCKDEPVFYALPTEMGCTEDLTREQIADYVRSLKIRIIAPKNSFHGFLESLGKEETEKFLTTFEEFVQRK
jgi:hypothetical protein